MDNATHLGLDVHKDTIAVAVLRAGQAEPDERTIANTPEALRALIRRGSLERPLACYEAGPTSYEPTGCSGRSASRATWSLQR
jgi:transposase